ncbi:PhnA-like protein [Methylobacterium sp. E-066]|uniref:PhnA-like protein n=1 Tax=Methylobacterium sp. E-066 TaxID=2836584 RepID=UPI001FB97E29|nr:PhnA-like protein [Methylobacterium sp. E-066]MCJ2142235.1 PhnA-like protein [Methylobacterium sp. E-066]
MATVTEPTPVSPGRPIPDRAVVDRELPQTTMVTPAEDMRTMMLHSVSWGAVLAGATVALISQVILNMLGLGIGLSTVDPMGDGTPAASSLGIGAGLWFVVSGVLAAVAGGYFAGRLSGKPSTSTAGYHGLLAWAVSTLVVLYMLSSAASGIVSGALGTASSAIGGVGNAMGGSVSTLAQAAAPSLTKVTDPFSNIESNVRNGTGSDPAALKDTAVTAMRAAVSGDGAQQAAAQEKAAVALSKAQNIPVEQARTQVVQYTQQFRETVASAKEQSKQIADATARRVSQGALFGALALIFGALASFFAGRGSAVDPTVTRTAPNTLTPRRA